MNNWHPLQTEKDFQDLLANSRLRPQIIFKHSTTCGISLHAMDKLVKGSLVLFEKADVHYLDLLKYRSLSDFIADALDVMHQSPQIIVIKKEKVIYKNSHHAIEVNKIVDQL